MKCWIMLRISVFTVCQSTRLGVSGTQRVKNEMSAVNLQCVNILMGVFNFAEKILLKNKTNQNRLYIYDRSYCPASKE